MVVCVCVCAYTHVCIHTRVHWQLVPERCSMCLAWDAVVGTGVWGLVPCRGEMACL